MHLTTETAHHSLLKVAFMNPGAIFMKGLSQVQGPISQRDLSRDFGFKFCQQNGKSGADFTKRLRLSQVFG